MNFPVIPQNLSISAMRSSGYRDSAHALAELIDNSVQSGLDCKTQTLVEVICTESAGDAGKRSSVSEIAVLDNAGGMDATTLRKALQFGNGSRLEKKKHTGIGKFGMGLPNSSISQCMRVEVWTWQRGVVCYSYLDVEEISKGTLTDVPEPVPSTVPSRWLRFFMNGMPENGTLVVWSKLDRFTWKQSATLLRHLEFITGRIYRRFIHRKLIQIRLAAYDVSQEKPHSRWESFVRPNDPLYLMAGSSAPKPYDQRAAFDPFGSDVTLSVKFRGEVHDVTIRASICKPEVRTMGGSSDIGKHAKRNQGVSVLRADRELELSKSFEVVDARERWWGIEVEFPPALDDVFGVTNNKQAATNFNRIVLGDDAETEGLTISDYKQLLERECDPRLPMYAISDEIDKLARALRKSVQKMRDAESVSAGSETLAAKVEAVATESVAKRRERIGDIGRSDRQEESESEAKRADELKADIVNDGIDPETAHAIAVSYVSKHRKFRVRRADLPTAAMFDVAATGGVIVLTFNTRHPVYPKIFAEFGKTEDFNPLAREVLSLMIAWARMEDEAGHEKIRSALEETREQWGRLAKDFFEAEEV